jgi:hypothetical protein
VNLKIYYEQVRQVEASITDPFPVLVSSATPEGGVGGRFTEAPRSIAARMIAEGSARLADKGETKAFRAQQAEAKRAAEQAAAAAKLQFTLLTTADLSKLKAGSKPAKD